MFSIGEAFDFKGRLSRAEQMRLGRKLLLIALPGMIVPILLLIAGVPRLLSALPALLLLPVCLAGIAANVRRLHDVGRHAHRVYSKRVGLLVCLAVPVVAVLTFPSMPGWLALTLIAIPVVGFPASLFVRDLGYTEWRRSDPGPNQFGPAPE